MSWLEAGLQILVPFLGAGIVVAELAVLGLRAHRMAEKHAPGLARGVPADVFIVVGLAVAACIVIGWVR